MSELETFIKSVPLFKSLGQHDVNKIAESMDKLRFDAGSIIFRQGDSGDWFYVVVEGQCEVKVKQADYIRVADIVRLTQELTFDGKTVPYGTIAKVDRIDGNRDYPYTVRIHGTGLRGRVLPTEIEPRAGTPDDKVVAKLKPGDYFGEQSLLKGAPRNATVITSTNCMVAVLNSAKFSEINLGEKLSFWKRKAIQTFDTEWEDSKYRDIKKDINDVELIKSAILSNKKLVEMVPLTDDQLVQLSAAAYKKPMKWGDIVIHQGDKAANEFFVVANGEFSITVSDASLSNENTATRKHASTKMVGTVKTGMSFGELWLLYQAPRAATVTC